MKFLLLLLLLTSQALEARELSIVREIHLPIEKLSGLAHYNQYMVAVGDHDAKLIFFKIEEGELRILKRPNFRKQLQVFSLCLKGLKSEECLQQNGLLSSDWEGLSSNGSILYILQEYSGSVLGFDEKLKLVKVIDIDYSLFENHENLGSGIIFSDGRLIIAKMDKPSSIVEYKLTNPSHSRTSTLVVNRSDFTKNCNITDIFGEGEKLYILSSSCRKIFVKTTEGIEEFSLPQSIENPEAMILTENLLLVGNDIADTKVPNLFFLERP